MAANRDSLKSLIRSASEREHFQALHWEGTFDDYLDVVAKDPKVVRNAFQRLYDLITSFGMKESSDGKETLRNYTFFSDPLGEGRDAVFGLTRPLMDLVNNLKSGAFGYGVEKRVLLLHGPVGSSKSTIVRTLKKGLEWYSRQKEGALYSFAWKVAEGELVPCPMNEEPLHLLPQRAREKILAEVTKSVDLGYQLRADGELCPFCRHYFARFLGEAKGDESKVLDRVAVRRIMISERDRCGIGTFQPKDEKNQDSTELTGDINYRKIAQFGSDSDPRAFNFDGEFNVANRGIIEFVEVLKLDVAFLYDLLGASQEHVIKPKKFPQTSIDEVIIGHSVAGDTPIPFRHEGVPGFTTLEGLHERFVADCAGLEVLAWDFGAGRANWTPVRRLLRHRFDGELLTTSQKWGAVETTPNHSIYGRDGQTFFPEERHEVLAVRELHAPLVTEEESLRLGAIDVVEGIAGFVREEAAVTAAGGAMTKPCRAGWARLDKPRAATAVRAAYDPIVDEAALKDLLTVLVWYATEGHVNGRNGGVVISQADPAQLERVRAAYAGITTGHGSIDAGAKTDSAWRLYLGSDAIARLCRHHCGEHSLHKRLPDFLFRLPRPLLQHAFDELMRTDGTRSVPPCVGDDVSPAYRERFFDFKTISPLLAAQVGTLATLFGHDYSVYRQERAGRTPAFRVRFCNRAGVRGGRQRRFEARLHRRPAAGAWVYDIECEGLHNFVCGVGNVVCHNTNEPEFKRLQNNELMEAFRDRTIRVDIPYNTTLDDEVRIYQKDYNSRRVSGKHIAPHTLSMAAMWAVLSRLEDPKNANLSLLQKLKLYNGKTLPGFTQDNIRELREESPREGMDGISPRYIQDKISNALVAETGEPCVNPFMVLNELEEGLGFHSLITNDDQRKRFRDLLATVKEEYEDIVKNEVQRAIAADEEAIARLCGNYLDNLKAYTQGEKVRNKYTGRDEEPDERLMRSIEEKIGIPDSRKEDFRREIMNYIGALAMEGKTFTWRSNERLQKALELKLFEDQKDSIKLTSLVSAVVDKDTQEKIDVVKTRLVKNYGYCDVCATDVLNFVASIFARGDTKES